MVEDEYRVVLDGIGERTGSVASLPHPRGEALEAFGLAVESFGPEIAAGNMRISVMSVAEHARRADQ